MTPKDVLCEARRLIENPDRWVGKCRMAEAVDGREVGPNHPDAYRFCLIGALKRASLNEVEYDVARHVVGELLGDHLIGVWNDNHTHAEVIGLLDQAIASQS